MTNNSIKIENELRFLQSQKRYIERKIDKINLFTSSETKIRLYYWLGNVTGKIEAFNMKKNNYYYQTSLPKDL